MHDHHHVIQLGSAWEPPARAPDADRVHWTRRFGRPGGLGPGDRVLLVVERSAVAADVVVNAVRLPPLSAGAVRWAQDITPLLLSRNELCVTLAVSVGDGELQERHGRAPLPSIIGMVALEIVAAGRPSSGPDDA
jgi:hypothetical protein